jgi:hypothetical protein
LLDEEREWFQHQIDLVLAKLKGVFHALGDDRLDAVSLKCLYSLESIQMALGGADSQLSKAFMSLVANQEELEESQKALESMMEGKVRTLRLKRQKKGLVEMRFFFPSSSYSNSIVSSSISTVLTSVVPNTASNSVRFVNNRTLSAGPRQTTHEGISPPISFFFVHC